MKRLYAAVGLFAAACGGGNAPSSPTPPTTPSAPVTPPVPTTYTVSGTLTRTNDGEPIAATMNFGVASTSSDSGGHYSITVPITAPTLSLTISGAGLIDRRTSVQPGTRTVNLDAIGAQGFDLNFYRRFVRDAYDTPSTLQPLRRWTRSPMIYLRTIDESGREIAVADGRLLDNVEGLIRETVPALTNGALSVANVIRGTETREGVPGWITVKFPSAGSEPGNCGRAQVAVEGGWIELNYRNNSGCVCPGFGFAPRTVRHEVGHAMGFWHTGDESDLMSGLPWSLAVCNGGPSARERSHAAIAYKRQPGNTDPDNDAVGTVNLTSLVVR